MSIETAAAASVSHPSSATGAVTGATAVTHVLRVQGRTPRYFVVTEVPAAIVRDGPAHETGAPCPCRICVGLPDGVDVLCVEQTDLAVARHAGSGGRDAAVTEP